MQYGSPSWSSITDTERWRRWIIRSESNLNADHNLLETVGYETVTEKISTGNGKTVYYYDIPNSYGSGATADWSPAYNHIARTTGCNSPGYHITGYYNSSLSPQTPYNFARGLLTKIEYFKEGDNYPVKEIVNTYLSKSIGSNSVKGVRYDYVVFNSSEYFFSYSDYTIGSNFAKVLASTLERTRDRSSASSYHETLTNFQYGSNHTMLSKSTLLNSDGTEVSKTFRYAKDYGSSSGTVTDQQVLMIDLLNQTGKFGAVIEQTESSKRSGQNENTFAGNLYMYHNFGNSPNNVVMAKEIWTLTTTGIANFPLSSFSAGAGTTFIKSTSYKKSITNGFKSKGDLVRSEIRQRSWNSFHTDLLSGIPIASIENAEAINIVYSNFDQNTDNDLDMIGFNSTDKSAEGYASGDGGGGWGQGVWKWLGAPWL
jgi:hypothetical protein